MRRQGRPMATATEIYDIVSESIQPSSQLTQGIKDTMKLRLFDEMFVELGLKVSDLLPCRIPIFIRRPRYSDLCEK
jgi:hypothetical protein